MVVRGSAWRAAICTSRRLTPASSIVVTNVWRSMWGCILGMRTPAVAASCLSRRVAAWRSIRTPSVLRRIGPSAAVDGPVDRPGHRRWQRDKHDLAAFTTHLQHPVAVFLAQVGDAGPARFEDPQPEQPEQ